MPKSLSGLRDNSSYQQTPMNTKLMCHKASETGKLPFCYGYPLFKRWESGCKIVLNLFVPPN